MSLASWSSSGLIAVYDKDTVSVSVVDPSVSLSDPLHCQRLELQEALRLLEWNGEGSRLLGVSETGVCYLWALEAHSLPLSLLSLGAASPQQAKCSPTAAVWCEHRRTFSWDPHAWTHPNSTPKAEALLRSTTATSDLVAVGKTGFVLLLADGTVRLVREPLAMSDGNASQFETIEGKLPLAGEPVLASSIITHSANGSMTVLARHRNSLTAYQLYLDSGVVLRATPKASISLHNGHESEQFHWLVQGNQIVQLVMQDNVPVISVFSGTELEPLSSSQRGQLPFECDCIRFNHSTATFVFSSAATPREVVSLCVYQEETMHVELDKGPTFVSIATDACYSPLIVSPNGFCVGRMLFSRELSLTPLFVFGLAKELKTDNLLSCRGIVEGLIASQFNGTDIWDLLQVVKASVKTLSARAPEAQAFISTILSEWLSLLASVSIPPADFYPVLLEFFKTLAFRPEFERCWLAADLVVSLKIAAAVVDMNIARGSIAEGNFELGAASLVSLVPVLKDALAIIARCSSELLDGNSPLGLLVLDDEVVVLIRSILLAADSAIRQLKTLHEGAIHRPQILLRFYKDLHAELAASLARLEPAGSTTSFPAILQTLRSDPQLQSKRTANLFIWLAEVLLDDVNHPRIRAHFQRVLSRFALGSSAKPAFETRDFLIEDRAATVHDSVSCLDLPAKRAAELKIYTCRKCARAYCLSSKRLGGSVYQADWQHSLAPLRCLCGGRRRHIQAQ